MKLKVEAEEGRPVRVRRHGRKTRVESPQPHEPRRVRLDELREEEAADEEQFARALEDDK